MLVDLRAKIYGFFGVLFKMVKFLNGFIIYIPAYISNQQYERLHWEGCFLNSQRVLYENGISFQGRLFSRYQGIQAFYPARYQVLVCRPNRQWWREYQCSIAISSTSFDLLTLGVINDQRYSNGIVIHQPFPQLAVSRPGNSHCLPSE